MQKLPLCLIPHARCALWRRGAVVAEQLAGGFAVRRDAISLAASSILVHTLSISVGRNIASINRFAK